jgi:twinkle protein
MASGDHLMVQSLIKLDLHRHNRPGYFSLEELPQQPSVAEIAVSTGWQELDQIWRPYPGQFNVLTGVAGHGKSTFALNVLVNLAKKHGTGSFLYVPENEAHVRDKLEKIWGREEGFKDFCRNQCFIQSAQPSRYDSEPKDLRWVLDCAGTAVEHDNASVVLIDPWNELERAKERNQLMTDYIGECLMMLKQFCRVTQATVIAGPWHDRHPADAPPDRRASRRVRASNQRIRRVHGPLA